MKKFFVGFVFAALLTSHVFADSNGFSGFSLGGKGALGIVLSHKAGDNLPPLLKLCDEFESTVSFGGGGGIFAGFSFCNFFSLQVECLCMNRSFKIDESRGSGGFTVNYTELQIPVLSKFGWSNYGDTYWSINAYGGPSFNSAITKTADVRFRSDGFLAKSEYTGKCTMDRFDMGVVAGWDIAFGRLRKYSSHGWSIVFDCRYVCSGLLRKFKNEIGSEKFSAHELQVSLGFAYVYARQ